MTDHDPIADLELLLAPVKADDPVTLARIRNARRAAAQRLADAAKLIKAQPGTFSVERRRFYERAKW